MEYKYDLHLKLVDKKADFQHTIKEYNILNVLFSTPVAPKSKLCLFVDDKSRLDQITTGEVEVFNYPNHEFYDNYLNPLLEAKIFCDKENQSKIEKIIKGFEKKFQNQINLFSKSNPY